MAFSGIQCLTKSYASVNESPSLGVPFMKKQ